ncbi:MAG: DUF1707 domain-containing protein [Gemmatimonadota bacterium]|nr:DUF1707 domain-containing protein [Gemmatimonadota bacterium]
MNEPTAATLGPEARQRTIDVLCESFAQDELDVEEFEQRVALVERAVNTEQLRAILADLRRAGCRLLSRLGYQVVTAEHGQEALDLLTAGDHEIDLVLSDVVMPNLSCKGPLA